MKKRQKIGIPTLMVLSMVLLAGFLAFWLNGQYQAEVDDLQTHMTYQFMASHDEVIDSVLIERLDPYIKDSFRIRENAFFKSDTSGLSGTATLVKLDYNAEQPVIIKKPDSVFTIIGADEEEFFLKGVRMVMKITGDHAVGNQSNEFFPRIDSTQLLGAFDERLRVTTGGKLTATWVRDSASVEINSKDRHRNKIFVTSSQFGGTQGIEVDRVFPFVIKKILPQILFAFFLLLLSGAAFLITYRSLRKQMVLNTTRNEFISNISHELKTPVATVKVALEALRSYEQIQDPQKTQDYLKMASSELDRLDHLTHKVLTHSKLESTQSFLELEHTDLVQLTQGVVHKLESKIESEQAQLSFIYSDPGIKLSIDPLYVEGILVNLIDNGLKYAGPEARLEIEITQDDQEVRLSVADRGPGIPKNYQRQVFEKFFRVPTQNTHNVKGHGLGLSFASLVMNQHGGSIKVQDRSGGGCIFLLIFPKNL